ncbi:alpha/beta fold hydrolase [Klenkia taihuensis]|uniref:Pimeloyl-ACP methyl ester carboxylesterase n=1 Tax=Klenkia taihuensis TaxID=1225127 RepID=A0A1I1UMH9_9ACTN|nr:alpha/beta hydrolase [Klenkia taihuensis]SFD70848.1 Pimeloyl-ACP methyl ester carboxylesterase [Klenkia taihuensis]
MVQVADGVQLWVEERGDPGAPAVLLVMGAASSGLVWPDELVDRLAASYRVVRYDHRDTGRSTRGTTYALRDLATDAVGVLDGLGVDRAHVVGMSMGGLLTQLLLLDHPDRLHSATLFCTGPLGGAAGEPAPPPADDLLAFWATMAEPRDDEAELAWRAEHWARLNGDQLDVDPAEWVALEQRVAAHSGGLLPATPHAVADQGGLARGAELAAVRVPVLVVEAPADPAYPPPNAQLLAGALGNARVVTVPGMGHALPPAVLGPLTDAIEEHLARSM